MGDANYNSHLNINILEMANRNSPNRIKNFLK